MSFAVAAEAYDRFMGRYSGPLAPRFADFATIAPDQRVLDVGCGPGALTAELVARLGPTAVAAVDPSDSFIGAIRERHPQVDARLAGAESLPFDDGAFDATVAQLVVHFMADPVAGLAEMRRVTRPGGTVAACVWDHGGGEGPLSPFWAVAAELDDDVQGEAELPGTHAGDLDRLFRQAGLHEVEEASLTVTVQHPTFDEWWEPFTLGVGTAGSYLAGVSSEQQAVLYERCRERLGPAPFSIAATAWTARGVA